MKQLNIKIPLRLTLFFVLVIFSSCRDWLSIAPENDLIKEKFWTKTADVESALGAAYNALRRASLESLIWGELRADMVTFGSDYSGYNQIAGSDISPTNGVISWQEYYSAINLANTLMYFDDEVLQKDKTFTPELKDAIEAEARFIRSMALFYVVRIWKDAPLVLDASISDTSNLYIEKSSEYEITDAIIQDLLVALDLASIAESNGNSQISGRANKYGIMALLADVYLWREEYQKCIDYCDLITNAGFSLEPLETWWDIYYPGNSSFESIIELQYNDNLENQENPIYEQMIYNGQVSMNQRNISLITDPLDVRGAPGLPIWKYQGKSLYANINRSNSERDANWILYRYAEIMLMKAEACIELNRFAEANELITETLLRAGMPYQPLNDKDLLRKEILDERGREFLFEGKRWFDLLRAAKRNNFENKQIIIDMILSGADIKQQAVLRTRVYDTLSYYLPIPERELIYNQNLVQNPYYDR